MANARTLPFDQNVLRIIDSALNRGNEGLRVVEDFVRMVLDDRYLTTQLKKCRHDLADAASTFSRDQLIASRNTVGDVGTQIQPESEYSRTDELALVQANMSRAQQALRTLEEYSKTVDPVAAKRFEQIRYTVYSLEKAVLTVQLSNSALATCRLCVLVDGKSSVDAFRQFISELIDAKTDLIQLRDKRLNDRQLLERGLVLSEMASNSETKWIANDRADLALAARAHGVHLGQDDLGAVLARRILGPTKWIGVSTRSLQQAHQAVMDGANYLGAGPVFPSASKTFDQLAGPEYLCQVSQEISLPIFAIGGIHPGNVEQVVQCGITRVAVSHCVNSADKPGDIVRQLKRNLV